MLKLWIQYHMFIKWNDKIKFIYFLILITRHVTVLYIYLQLL